MVLLWLLLVMLVYAPTGTMAELQHEINIYTQDNFIYLNFTAYINAPNITAAPEDAPENPDFYNIINSKDARIVVYDDDGNVLCDTIATVRDDEGKYWGVCLLNLNDGVNYIHYNITLPNTTHVIKGFKRVFVKHAGGNLIVSTSVSPIGVDVGKELEYFATTVPYHVYIWAILFVVFMGSALYYRGERLALAIFDLLFPKLPTPRLKLKWAPGMTPGGPILSAIKKMGEIKKIFSDKTAITTILRKNIQKSLNIKDLDPVRGERLKALLRILPENVPTVLAYLTLRLAEDIEAGRRTDIGNIENNLKKAIDIFNNAAKSNNPSIYHAELEATLNQLVSGDPRLHNIKTQIMATFETYTAIHKYSQAQSSITAKFYPLELLANYAKFNVDDLVKQLRERRFLAEKLAKKFGLLGYLTGWAADKTIGAGAYMAGIGLARFGQVVFWLGKTTRGLRSNIDYFLLPVKHYVAKTGDPAELDKKAAQYRKKRDQYLKIANAFAVSGAGLYNLGEKVAQEGQELIEKDDIRGLAKTPWGRFLQAISYFAPLRWAIGVPIGAFYYGTKALIEDVKASLYEVPVSKDLRPESSPEIVKRTTEKAVMDAGRFLILDRVNYLKDLIKQYRDLHGTLFRFYSLESGIGSNAALLKGELERLYNQLESNDNPEIRKTLNEINELIQILALDSLIEKEKRLMEYSNKLEVYGTEGEVGKVILEELDSLYNSEVETKEETLTFKDILEDPEKIRESNISLFDNLLTLDRRVRERTGELEREVGIFEKDYQSIESDDPYIRTTHNFRDEEMYWINAINWGIRVRDFVKGLALHNAIEIQNVAPITETWLYARMLGYETPEQLFQDQDIDDKVKERALGELLYHQASHYVNSKNFEHKEELLHDISRLLTLEEPQHINMDKYNKEEQSFLQLLIKDIAKALSRDDLESLDLSTQLEGIPSFRHLWSSIPGDKNFQDMALAFYKSDPQTDPETIDDELARKRALQDFHDLKEGFVESIKRATNLDLTHPEVIEKMSDYNQFVNELATKDPTLNEAFNIYDDKVFDEGFASSKFNLNVVSLKDLESAHSTIADYKDYKEWNREILQGNEGAMTINRAKVPYIFMVKKESTNIGERTAISQSYLQYAKGTQSHPIDFTMNRLSKQYLELEATTSSPYTSYADQLPNQIAHMVSGLLVTQKILEFKGFDVKVDDISIKDMKDILYSGKVLKVNKVDGKLKLEETSKPSKDTIVGHDGKLYNIFPYQYTHVVVRNDEAKLLPLLYGDGAPRFIKELKKSTKRRLTSLIDERYLATLTIERLASPDETVNVLMLRWDPVKKEYVRDITHDVKLPFHVYNKVISNADKITQELSKHFDDMRIAVDSIIYYGDANIYLGLMEALSALKVPKDLPEELKGDFRKLANARLDQSIPSIKNPALEQYLWENASKSLAIALMREKYALINRISSKEQLLKYFSKRKETITNHIRDHVRAERLALTYSITKDPQVKQELERFQALLSNSYYTGADARKLFNGIYLGALDSVKHNEWLGIVGLIARDHANEPHLMKYIRNSYIIDEIDHAYERAAKPPVKVSVPKKVERAFKQRFLHDLHTQHMLIQNVYLRYAQNLEVADHNSSIAQIKFPTAASLMAQTYSIYDKHMETHLKEIDKNIKELNKRLKETKDKEERSQIKEQINQLLNEKRLYLLSLNNLYNTDVVSRIGWIASAWTGTTRSAEKIYSTITGFTRGAQIAADFHAGSGLYYPIYILMAHTASESLYQAVARHGMWKTEEFMLQGWMWGVLPSHELSVKDYWDAFRTGNKRKLHRFLLEHNKTAISNPGTLRYWNMVSMLDRFETAVGATWRSLFQPITLGGLAEKLAIDFGIGAHARVAEVRKYYQAYSKVAHRLPSSLDIAYSMSEEELEAYLSTLPPYEREFLKEQISRLIVSRNYYSAKHSVTASGVSPALILAHLSSFSPFSTPRNIWDNPVWGSFTFHTLGMFLGIPGGVFFDVMEGFSKYKTLQWTVPKYGKEMARGSPRLTDGLGITDWEERIGYYLIPAGKHEWLSPTIAKRGDLPGYGDVDWATGRLRQYTWLPRMYLHKEHYIYDTNRTHLSWVARWREAKHEQEVYSPRYTFPYGFLLPPLMFDYFTPRWEEQGLMGTVQSVKEVPKKMWESIGSISREKVKNYFKRHGGDVLLTGLAAGSIGLAFGTPALIGTSMFFGGSYMAGLINKHTKDSAMPKCPVCGTPKRRGFRCPRCGAP